MEMVYQVTTSTDDNWVTDTEVFYYFNNAVMHLKSKYYGKENLSETTDEEFAYRLLRDKHIIETWDSKDYLNEDNKIMRAVMMTLVPLQ